MKNISKVLEGDNTSKGSIVVVEYGKDKIKAQIIASPRYVYLCLRNTFMHISSCNYTHLFLLITKNCCFARRPKWVEGKGNPIYMRSKQKGTFFRWRWWRGRNGIGKYFIDTCSCMYFVPYVCVFLIPPIDSYSEFYCIYLIGCIKIL